jgi:hypothetical protein
MRIVERLRHYGFISNSPVIDKDEDVPLAEIMALEVAAIQESAFLIAATDGVTATPFAVGVMMGISFGLGVPIVTYSTEGFGLNGFLAAMVEKHCYSEDSLFTHLGDCM